MKYTNKYLYFLIFILFLSCKKQENSVKNEQLKTTLIKFNGLLGEALLKSTNNRILTLMADTNQSLVRLYHKDTANKYNSFGWKGETMGKWLYTATLCYKRTKDEKLLLNIRNIADFIIKNQSPDGYLGTFNDTSRFNGTKKRNNQTFDLWMNGYVMQGLCQLYEATGDKKYLTAAQKIGNLCIDYFQTQKHSLVNSGPFSGMVSAAILEHFVDLYTITKEKKYLNFAYFIVNDIEKRPGTELISRTLAKYDAAQIGEGKMYELIRCYVGIAKLYRVTKNPIYKEVVINAWNEINTYHLNASGAPAGGVGIHPECFNFRYMFSPYFNSETCALMDWIRLNKELFAITKHAKYTESIEKALYNALLGAQNNDGSCWQYHSLMNGPWHCTALDACCSSSGAMALEEVSGTVINEFKNSIWINFYEQSEYNITENNKNTKISINGNYPFAGKQQIIVTQTEKNKIKFYLRIPTWATNFSILNKGKDIVFKNINGYGCLNQVWDKNDTILIQYDQKSRFEKKLKSYEQHGYYTDVETAYYSFHNGPILYGTEWNDNINNPNPAYISNPSVSNKIVKFNKNLYIKGLDTTFILKPYFRIANKSDSSSHTVWFTVK